MSVIYFTQKLIDKQYLQDTAHEDNGLDYEIHDNYEKLGQKLYSDAGLVSIEKLIAILVDMNSKGANYVSCDWHCDHQELEVHGVLYRASTKEEIQVEIDALQHETQASKQREIDALEKRLKDLKSE
jgi:diketogulonate reductase-like aldo/keto reductase